MVEQTRQPSRVVSLQAGPGEVDTGTLFDMNLRYTARAFGRQLAVIGDQLEQEWANRQHCNLVLLSCRDIHSQLWGLQGLSAAVKAWIASTAPGQGILRADTWATWVKLMWYYIRGSTIDSLVTVALVAAVTIFGALWMEWKA
uniref:Uncharacterized protein n=1 Tax=Dicentrarchus labrax TaxID=13489 RepID=A0A8C4P139_DICLA